MSSKPATDTTLRPAADTITKSLSDSAAKPFTDTTARLPDSTAAPIADTIPRKDLVDVLIKLFKLKLTDTARRKNSLIFSFVPISAVNIGQKQAAVSSINMAFYAGDRATTNISSIYFVPYTNFSDRYGFIVTPNVWLRDNEWNLTGDFRISSNTIYTYALGANSSEQDRNEVSYQYIRVYVNAYHKLVGPFNIGMGYDYDYFYSVTDRKTAGYPNVFSNYGVGTGPQTTSSGLSFNLLVDKRKNSINPYGGIYSSVIYRINPSFLTNDYSWTSLYFDTRKYFSFHARRHSVLALWFLYWGTYGDVPYFNLPGTAQDLSGRAGRGYDWGRFRGKQMLYGESEYRFDISRDGLLGGVVFFNMQSYTQQSSGQFAYVLPAGGTGLRLKFNKRSDTNITFDIAAGKNSFNWYINLGEFF
jgi:hypothetical protein